MEIYVYKARNIYTQQQIKGELTAENQETAYNTLVEKNLYPTFIRKKGFWYQTINLSPKVKKVDVVFLCKQFSAMLGAGIGIVETLEVCKNQCTNRTLKIHLENIDKSIQEGKPLWIAMEEEAIFPTFMIRLMECGEQTGCLPQAIQYAEEHLDNQLKTQATLKKALTYPTLVLGLVAIIIVIMVFKMLPNYIDLLEDIGGEMPIPTQFVIQASAFVSNYWFLIGVSFFLLISGLYGIYHIPKVKAFFEAIYLKIPLLNQLIKKTLSAEFSSTLAMMLASGVPVLEAMEIMVRMTHYSTAQQEIKRAIKKLEEGYLLADAFKNSAIYPPILLSMISVGEESHTLVEILSKMALYFKGEVTKDMEQVVTLVQPLTMILIGLILGGIIAAILLPTFSAVTAVL